jgi:anti-sigma B factor antagonist
VAPGRRIPSPLPGGRMEHATLSVPPFDCRLSPDGDRVVVRLAGELDLTHAATVAGTLAELFDAGFACVVVDLRGLRFMDSTGIRALLAARRTALAREARLSLVRGPTAVHRVFELTRTDALFDFHDARTVG